MLPIFFDFIKIDEYSATPKYLQLANSIITAIESTEIKQDSLLPSINALCYKFDLSRDTIQKSYRHLKEIGVIDSFPGKGYCISRRNPRQQLKIFLLFNKLSANKKIIYDALIAGLGNDTTIDFYIYNNDTNLFNKLLTNRKRDYTHYVIMPPFADDDANSAEILNKIPRDRLILLDRNITGIQGRYSSVFQNFEKDIYGALFQARPQLTKYHTLKLIFPEQSYFPAGIITGFQRFCRQYAFRQEVISDINTAPVKKGEVFINLMEDDLVTLLQRIVDHKFKLGKDVGVISYDENPIKSFILTGISTISTDFKYMGATTAAMILENSKRHIEVPFYYTRRASL
ncbi:MAG: GntR family transcriptional regulator [Bacteroidetes bacterium]|nr:GntR family transcriptional regulator [Bacteroidota bacterium]